MPLVELLPVPKDPEALVNYLMQNFRRVSDALARSPAYTDKSDIVVTDFNKGFVLTSPNGTRYRIAVSNAGVLSTVLA